MNRRSFLKTTSNALAFAAAAQYVPTTFAAQKTRRVGLIGCGWYGKGSLFRMLQVEPAEVVSLCDVDSRMLAEAAGMVAERQKSGRTPRMYGDFREMLKEKDLDIVMVSTPDHWHAVPSIAAMQAGADVYVEKPISVDVVEGQAMVAAARKYGRVVQVNTQRRSTPHLIEAVDRVIRAGKLGTIGHVEICCYWGMGRAGNPPDVPVPDHLDYEMWTGPAPMRPFNRRTHPRGWRAFMEYSNGIVGDMCIHMLDMVRWMLDLGWPRSVSSTGGILVEKDGNANTTDTQTAVFDFDQVQVVWKHRTYGDMPDPDYPWAATIYGDKGTLKASVYKYEYFERGKQEPALAGEALYEYDQYPEDRTEKDLERHVASAMRRHWRNYLECVDHRTRPVADIEQAFISSAACIMANMSVELGGRTLAYDPETQRVTGGRRAGELMARPYRAPWTHPTPESV
ncbi:MAG: Gfo/Idh/MocA family oxidoreductase [Verrucomicrobiales bacterium]|nr:Gfo/Idh/MocA family oxidoreductase [Verrucomicrobiales bacterium]MCP5528495.1 Gfo/Idh/MocA family oxidoreductase [Verrucomicrobiales bacterium]